MHVVRAGSVRQNARLSSRAAHDVARADLLGRIDRLAAALASRPFQPGLVVGPRRSRRQPHASYVLLVLGRLADVHAERNPGTGQQPAQSHELVFRQGVHRIDDDGADARRRVIVPKIQAPANDRIEEALGLARAGAGGDQGGPAFRNRAHGAFLVAVQMAQRFRDTFAQMGVQQSVADQGVDRCALSKRARKTHVRALEQRRPAGLVERQQVAHMAVQPVIGERIRRELVAQEAADDVLGVGDRVQRHRANGRGQACSRLPAFPELQLVFRERLEEGVRNRELSLQGAGLPLTLGSVRDEPCHRCAPTGDRDLFTRLDPCQQSGQLGLGLADVDDGHAQPPSNQDDGYTLSGHFPGASTRLPGRALRTTSV